MDGSTRFQCKLDKIMNGYVTLSHKDKIHVYGKNKTKYRSIYISKTISTYLIVLQF